MRRLVLRCYCRLNSYLVLFLSWFGMILGPSDHVMTLPTDMKTFIGLDSYPLRDFVCLDDDSKLSLTCRRVEDYYFFALFKKPFVNRFLHFVLLFTLSFLLVV